VPERLRRIVISGGGFGGRSAVDEASKWPAKTVSQIDLGNNEVQSTLRDGTGRSPGYDDLILA
jgi:hypothetical protein